VKIKCTEGKSVGGRRSAGNMVRVFVDNDFHYGYWVVEEQLLALLDVEVQAAYLRADADFTVDVEPSVAQKVVDMGMTPYNKVKVA
jgi:hypothetical protein